MRSARELFGVLAAGAAVVFGACSVEDADVDGPPPTRLADRECPPDSVLTYESFGGPFIYSYCSGCHSKDLPEGMRQEAPMGSDFDTLDATREWSARIWARAADHNLTMPPIGGPDDDEREMLGEWLACGAPALD